MKRKTFFAFTAPSNIVMVTLMILPLGLAIWFGLNYITYTNVAAPNFVGLSNYQEVLEDVAFWDALRWTLVIIMVVVPAHIIIAFVLSVVLDQITGRIRAFYLAGLLAPMIVVPVIGTIVFRQLFDPSGLIAWFLRVTLDETFVFTETSMKSFLCRPANTPVRFGRCGCH